ncbi:MAG: YceI family protein [Bacteroidota bacterium]
MNLLFAFLFSVLFAPVNDYTVLADQAKIGFTIKNAGFKVNGSMKGLDGDISFNPDALDQSKISLSVATATIDTDNKTRDKHLRAEDYFEVEKYPNITFTSTSIKKSGNGYLVKGTFKVKNTAKDVEIPFTFQQNVFKGSFSINRIEYGVGKKSWIMDKTVNITFQIPVSG